MTVHLVTFSDESMSESSWRCALSSKQHGVETHSRFHPSNIGTWQEVLEHPEIFRQPEDPRRAWAWWAWKPLIIRQEMSWLPDGSTLIYSDAGIKFINNVNYIIDRMGHGKPQDDIFLFGNNWEHAHWCKADVIGAVWPEAVEWGAVGTPVDWARFGRQCQASVIFFRVSDYSRRFVGEWLTFSLARTVREGRGERYLIDDSESFFPNHPEFREHRHDQAILTTMAYREGIKLHWWPAMYNDGAFTYEKLPEYAGDTYPAIVHHHRRRDHEWGKIA